MLTITATRTVDCSPETFLDFVMDARRYQAVDTKIRPVLWSRRRGNVSEFVFVGRLAGLWTPPTHSRMTLTPGSRVDIRLARSPSTGQRASRPTSTPASSHRHGAGHAGRPHPERRPEGPLDRWEQRLRPRLQAEVDEEMDLAAAHVAGRA